MTQRRMKLNQNTNKIMLYTIGFAKKSAEDFFSILKLNHIETLIDVRLNNVSQLAGFTKKKDLQYFLKELCGIAYSHKSELAPTKEILDAYKKKEISWSDYEIKYKDLLFARHVSTKVDPCELNMSCLLCSEPTADKCHRRLLAEYLQGYLENIVICHL